MIFTKRLHLIFSWELFFKALVNYTYMCKSAKLHCMLCVILSYCDMFIYMKAVLCELPIAISQIICWLNEDICIKVWLNIEVSLCTATYIMWVSWYILMIFAFFFFYEFANCLSLTTIGSHALPRAFQSISLLRKGITSKLSSSIHAFEISVSAVNSSPCDRIRGI